MYTQCPECETTFKLAAEDLRLANGRVRCGDCDAVFNALEYLAEQVTEAADEEHGGWTDSAANPTGDLEPDLEAYEESAFDEDDDEDNGSVLYIDAGEDEQDEEDNELPAEHVDELDDTSLEDVPGVGEPEDWHPEDEADGDAEDNNLEFDVPADNWSNFFGPLPKGQSATVWTPPPLGDEDSDDDSDDDGNEEAELTDPTDSVEHDEEIAEASDPLEEASEEELEEELAEELAEEAEDESDDDDTEEHASAKPGSTPDWRETSEPRSRGRLLLLGTAALAIALTTQLTHYNRDSIAAHPEYGSNLRQIYAVLGSELYPDWDLGNYEIRGSEAIAGESGPDVLDIRAQIANTGDFLNGLPRVRVVLRDRWSNPVAAQDFGAEEYIRNGSMPEAGLLQPGAVVDIHISIQDPGSGAQGFELELCLPRRDTGLECTDQPFK
jgi:predicted Zn finger-like uncharacterized protein